MKLGLFAVGLVLLLLAAAAAAAQQVLQRRQAAAALVARQRTGPTASLQQLQQQLQQQQQLLQQQQPQSSVRIEAEQDPILYTDDGAYYGGDWWDWGWPMNPYQWGGGGYYSGPFYEKRWGGGRGKWDWQTWADGRKGPQVRPGPPIGGGVAPL
jgi:hypothetical protein